MIYLRLAAASALVLLGAGLCYLMYTSPRINSLKLQIEQIKEADAQAADRFLRDAQKAQKEMADAADERERAYVQAQADSNRRIAGLRADGARLRDTINAYSNAPGLPQATANACCADGRSQELGRLLAEGTDLLIEGAAIVKQDADTIRALQGVQSLHN